MAVIIESDNFGIKILTKFDIDEFDRLYDACKNSIRKNLSWPSDVHTCDDRRKHMEIHYRSFFGQKAKLQGKLVYGIYHKNDTDLILLYCSATKNMLLRALQIEITMFGKNKNGLKSWIPEFYLNSAELMKKFTHALGLRSWFYSINNDSEFVKKNLYAINGVVRDIIVPENKFFTNRKIITSEYGW